MIRSQVESFFQFRFENEEKVDMQPNYIEIAKLFSNDERFTVPLFQRPYVWSKEGQWEPLWDDVVGVLERLQARKGEENVASHFLGTIVLEQKPHSIGELTRREVIDGQQRLTTIQLMLKAAEHMVHEAMQGVGDGERQTLKFEHNKIARLTSNEASDEQRYKVWPTNEDREPFQHVMDCVPDDDLDGTSNRMTQAYQFFHNSIREYLCKFETVSACKILVTGLRDYLKIIVLDLDAGDEPQAIFETLNAHGTPLLPADLTKNWLLWEAGRQKLDIADLYERNWKFFDRDHSYWRKIVGKGHAARARIDTFLQNWLTKQTEQPVSSKHIYDRFLRYAASRLNHDTDLATEGNNLGRDIAVLMNAIRVNANHFRRIDQPTDNTRFGLFLNRLKSLDVIVFHPLLLAVLENHEGNQKALDGVAVALESYLVRRMVCGMQTRGYGTLGIKLLKSVKGNVSVDPDNLLRNELQALSDSDEWPNDTEFRRNWVSKKFYGNFRRARVLMILQAIEHYHQSTNPKAEPLMSFDWTKLQIEHIMPQSWEQNWPLPDGVEAEDRKINLQGIGNLTLVSQKLNPTLSNSAWSISLASPGKREHLKKHTVMHLNRMLLSQFHDDWNDETIEKRASYLFEDALKIWPKNS